MDTLKELADYLDMSDRNLREVLKKLGIEKVDFESPESVDSVRVAYIRYLRELAAGRGGEEQQGRLTAARVRETELKGDKLELEMLQSSASLVDVDEMTQYFTAMVLSARGELMSLTAKLADYMQAEHKIDIDKGYINELIGGALANLERGDPEDDG